jgi:hypothetical protein
MARLGASNSAAQQAACSDLVGIIILFLPGDGYRIACDLLSRPVRSADAFMP